MKKQFSKSIKCINLIVSILILLVYNSSKVHAGIQPREVNVYRGSTPVLDGIISKGEYDDATSISDITNWFHYNKRLHEKSDLSFKAWVKHDGKDMYFAFDITDDVIYGIDIPRWLPDDLPSVHEFTPDKGLPWFGDGIEIFLNPGNTGDISNTNGKNAWIVACSSHKSFLNKLEKGGLIEGEPKTAFAWSIYRKWISYGAMKATVRIKSGNEGNGYVIEWKIAANPCLEVKDGTFWNPAMGVVKMGINLEIQDLDEKEKGSGNWANMHHVEVWESVVKNNRYSKTWGTLNMYPGRKPQGEGKNKKSTDFVNPFIGTSNGGNTHPGSVLPWGMISVSPYNSYDTVSRSTGTSPYYFGKKYISGFTHANMSGVGCNDLGIACFMPTTGQISFEQPRNCSAYSNEIATPGYYSVNLNKFNVIAELTATTRMGLSRFTFPEGKSNIILNLSIGSSPKKGAVVKMVSDTEIEGFKTIGDFCGIKNIQTVYFYARLSKSPKTSGVFTGANEYPDFNREVAGNDIGAYFSFDTKENEAISVAVAISYVSVENARKNLESELSSFDFDGTRAAAELAWNHELSKISVEGGTYDDKVKFYTALYHALIQPSLASDVNGEYAAMGSNKTLKAEGYNRHTVFSLWDTYRNVHPFLSLVYPKRQSNMVKTMLGMYKEGGWLPKWEFAGNETFDMVGDPAVPVIVDSYERGIRDFDANLAYEAIVHNASVAENGNPARPGLKEMLKYGYIPEDSHFVLKSNDPNGAYKWANLNRLQLVWGSVSTTMEYCIADWNISQMAKALGKTEDYKLFYERSLSYKNYFNDETGFIRPKLTDGSWLIPFDLTAETGFTEGSTWNYTFMVPHDIPGLMKLMGGPKKFSEKLTECFEKKHFFMANEPDIAYPYLFNYVKGEEWKTQKYVRNCVNEYFFNSPGGIWGNDDCGTMSTWLMYAMMGFYPDCPGNMDYQIASPVFSKITIMLDPEYYSGKTFVIEAENAGKDNCYVRSMRLNGKPYRKFILNHQDIIQGGKLEFILSDKKIK
jgi:predicted alpha-1,2-mannosidase